MVIEPVIISQIGNWLLGIQFSNQISIQLIGGG